MALHDDFGHLGMEKTLGLLKDRFFWPKMSEDVRQHIRSCERCTTLRTDQNETDLLYIPNGVSSYRFPHCRMP